MLSNDLSGFMAEREKSILQRIALAVGLPDSEMPPSTLIKPDTPFSNESAIIETINECREYVWWVDKYFSRKGMEWLANALQGGQVGSIRILTSASRPTLERTEGLRKSFKKFRAEMKTKGIDSELKILADPKVEKSIHDRWLITKNMAYSVPSIDTIQMGQASLITRDVKPPDFEEWWNHSLDIVEDWNRIRVANT